MSNETKTEHFLSDPDQCCPSCSSRNIEEHTPQKGTHTCRDCREWIEDEAARCKWCNEFELQGDPGDFYHEHACEAEWCRRQLKTETDPVEIKALERQLESARDVGD